MVDAPFAFYCALLRTKCQPVPVEIAPSLTVGHLQEAIVRKLAGKDSCIDYLTMKLWCVNIVYDTAWEEKIRTLESDGLGVELFPGASLSHIFREPPHPNHIHIIVGFPADGADRFQI
jgi:hypothetical protein